MGQFRTELVARKIREAGPIGRAQWQLEDELVFDSDIVGTIRVPAGFVTDFASVPRIPLVYWIAGDTAHKSAVVHDYLCRVWHKDCLITWSRAADVFNEAMRAEGVPAWRRAIMTFAVKIAPHREDCDGVYPGV